MTNETLNAKLNILFAMVMATAAQVSDADNNDLKEIDRAVTLYEGMATPMTIDEFHRAAAMPRCRNCGHMAHGGGSCTYREDTATCACEYTA